jgi:hypothetical protein
MSSFAAASIIGEEGKQLRKFTPSRLSTSAIASIALTIDYLRSKILTVKRTVKYTRGKEPL